MIRGMIKADHLPDYEISKEEGDLIRFSAQAGVIEENYFASVLSTDALDAASELAPG